VKGEAEVKEEKVLAEAETDQEENNRILTYSAPLLKKEARIEQSGNLMP
jgi:hypothetical protein